MKSRRTPYFHSRLYCIPVIALALCMVACGPTKTVDENIDAGGAAVFEGNLRQAETYYLAALDEIEHGKGPETKYHSCLYDLSQVYLLQSRRVEAEAAQFRGLEFCKKRYGNDSSGVAESLHTLGSLYNEEKEPSKARDAFQKAQAILDRLPQPDYALSFSNLSTLAKYYDSQNDYLKAAEFYKKALDSAAKTAEVSSGSKTLLMEQYAILCRKLGKNAEAEELYRQSVTLGSQDNNYGNSVKTDTLLNLADSYCSDSNKAGLAEPLYKRALEIEEGMYGKDSVKAANCLHKLASYYVLQNRYADAEMQFKPALKIRETTGRSDVIGLIKVLDDYSALLRKMNKIPEAEVLELRSKELKFNENAQRSHK